MIWEPATDAWAASRMGDLAAFAGRTAGADFTDYRSLFDWSLADPGPFWRAIAEWSGVVFHDEPRAALGSTAMPRAEWFPGATLNHAELALAQASRTPDATAIVSVSQTRARCELCWADLADQVARCRVGLVELGVTRGDRVVAFLPNIAETTVAFLATASLGAIWSSCAPEFGVRAVTDRWRQIEPKVLLTIDGYRYGARDVDRTEQVTEIIGALPTLEHVVRLAYLDSSGDDGWARLLDVDPATAAAEMAFEPVPFDHPLYVLFSSGTTGLPKAIVHGHGGITLEHVKALALHYDLGPGSRFSWFTTTGWMMWNLLTSAALVGATAVLFDGDPGAPDLSTLWKLAADERVEVLGVSAPFVMACRKAGLSPGEEHDLSALRHLGSTGAPLPPEGFEWIADAVGDVQIGSLSGGTDVCTGFVGPAPTVPVRLGEISTRMLGCDVAAFRADGTRCDPNETGELVITQPMPSMPVGFWADDDGSRYHDAYFSEFPDVWYHGDWITFTETGGCIITGRSDATLNRGGVRLGTSDFYTVVESLPEVADSLVVHLEDDDDGGPGRLILLVALADGQALDDGVVDTIRRRLRSELSPRHVPDEIAVVRAIPRTLSGKKLEVPVKRMLQGVPSNEAASRDSLANPTSLDAIADWVARR